MTNYNNENSTSSNEKEFWKVSFKYMMDQMGKLLGKEGKSLHAYNVDAHWDQKSQYFTFMDTVDKLKDKDDCIVTSSLPGGERIFWPYYDTQFFIRDKEERIYFKGNSEIIRNVLDIPEKRIHRIIPKLEFWKEHSFSYHVDTTKYKKPKDGSAAGSSVAEAIVNQYKSMQTKPFINTEWWYMLKFFFMASWYGELDEGAEFIGAVPKDLKIQCECEQLVNIDYILRALFKIQEFDVEHDYCLYVGEECEECGTTMCIYRPKAELCTPLTPFMNFLTDNDHQMKDEKILMMWHFILAEATLRGEREKVEDIYGEDMAKYAMAVVKRNKK